jgi:hypothetical protein
MKEYAFPTGSTNGPQTAHGFTTRLITNEYSAGRQRPDTVAVNGDGLTKPFDEETEIVGNGLVTNTTSSITTGA